MDCAGNPEKAKTCVASSGVELGPETFFFKKFCFTRLFLAGELFAA